MEHDSLVLDIGGEIGALVIHADAALDGAEIELSPVGADANRFHNMVHPRRAGATTMYTAVYPAVTEGAYTVWRNKDTRHGIVNITGGQVTEYVWL